MVDGDPLGPSRGARRVDDVGQLIRLHRYGLRKPFFGGEAVHGDDQRAFGPAQRLRVLRLRQNGAEARAVRNLLKPGVRDMGVHGDVDGTRQRDARNGDDLFPALFHHHPDKIPAADALVRQSMRDGTRTAENLFIRQRPCGGYDGRGVGRRLSLPEEKGGQRFLGKGAFGGVVADPGLPLGFGKRERRGLQPRGVVRGQPIEQPHVGVEHGFHEPLREQPLDGVPVEHEAALLLIGLVVEPYLRSLGDARDEHSHAGEPRRVAACLSKADRPGEHDGHARRFAAQRKLAQHLHAAHKPMAHVFPELPLDAEGAFPEGCAGNGVHGEQVEGGEIPDDIVDLIVQRKPVEQRQVQGKAGAGTPASQRFGIGGYEQAGRRQPVPADAGLEALPDGGLQNRAQAYRPGRVKFRRLLRQRKFRRGRQVVQAFFPIFKITAPEGGIDNLPLRKHIVAEGQAQFGESLAGRAVQPQPFVDKQEDAPCVGDHGVEIEEQAEALFPVPQVPGHADIEQRPCIRREQLPGHGPADIPDSPFRGRIIPQIINRETVLAHGRQDRLRAVRQEHGAQHLVAFDQPVPGTVEPFDVHARIVKFKIDVARNLSQFVGPDAADPVGILHVRQRERLGSFPFPRLHGG